jgi:hypothetical protein
LAVARWRGRSLSVTSGSFLILFVLVTVKIFLRPLHVARAWALLEGCVYNSPYTWEYEFLHSSWSLQILFFS